MRPHNFITKAAPRVNCHSQQASHHPNLNLIFSQKGQAYLPFKFYLSSVITYNILSVLFIIDFYKFKLCVHAIYYWQLHAPREKSFFSDCKQVYLFHFCQRPEINITGCHWLRICITRPVLTQLLFSSLISNR